MWGDLKTSIKKGLNGYNQQRIKLMVEFEVRSLISRENIRNKYSECLKYSLIVKDPIY